MDLPTAGGILLISHTMELLLAVGGEDGMIRIWRMDTGDSSNEDAVRILHVSSYLEQLPEANTENGVHIPEPVPPPPIVQDYFQLDPFYEQWVDVEGFPILASAKVNPYALKEAAWLIRQMIGHRTDILQAMVEEKARFAVIAHTEIITEIPEYRNEAHTRVSCVLGTGCGLAPKGQR